MNQAQILFTDICGIMKSVTHIAIFASGAGSNAENLIQYFKHDSAIQIRLICSNNPKANVLNIALNHGIEHHVIQKENWESCDEICRLMRSHHIAFIILAGFLWKIPVKLITLFPDKIINIHPSLLPKYGGKGMYGMHVHRAVIAAGEKQSGITIHLVNAEYDKGRILFQTTVAIEETDTPESLAGKINSLEHRHFPSIIKDYIFGL